MDRSKWSPPSSLRRRRKPLEALAEGMQCLAYWMVFLFGIVVMVLVPFVSIDMYTHGTQKHIIAWYTAALFVLLATIISVHMVFKHLTNWYNPLLQKYVVRILWMVPVYAIESWLSLRFHSWTLYLNTLRDCYEAYVIYCFLYLMIAYMGEEVQLVRCLSTKPPDRGQHLWPFNYFLRPWRLGRPFLMNCKWGTLQYVVVKAFCTLLTMIFELLGLYHEGDFAPRFGYLYITMLANASQMWALYCLVLYYYATREDLAPIRPLAKFVCVKAVVFFCWWQSVGIAFLVQAGLITSTDDWSREEVAKGLQDYAICAEMFLASIAHHYAFSYKDFALQDESDGDEDGVYFEDEDEGGGGGGSSGSWNGSGGLELRTGFLGSDDPHAVPLPSPRAALTARMMSRGVFQTVPTSISSAPAPAPAAMSASALVTPGVEMTPPRVRGKGLGGGRGGKFKFDSEAVDRGTGAGIGTGAGAGAGMGSRIDLESLGGGDDSPLPRATVSRSVGSASASPGSASPAVITNIARGASGVEGEVEGVGGMLMPMSATDATEVEGGVDLEGGGGAEAQAEAEAGVEGEDDFVKVRLSPKRAGGGGKQRGRGEGGGGVWKVPGGRSSSKGGGGQQPPSLMQAFVESSFPVDVYDDIRAQVRERERARRRRRRRRRRGDDSEEEEDEEDEEDDEEDDEDDEEEEGQDAAGVLSRALGLRPANSATPLGALLPTSGAAADAAAEVDALWNDVSGSGASASATGGDKKGIRSTLDSTRRTLLSTFTSAPGADPSVVSSPLESASPAMFYSSLLTAGSGTGDALSDTPLLPGSGRNSPQSANSGSGGLKGQKGEHGMRDGVGGVGGESIVEIETASANYSVGGGVTAGGGGAPQV